ncbi:MAG: hypothetical protein LBE59_07825 [Nevskiaceae bacterium]|jgi:hypothetical protein|nr:hypothetical protein [Nevskiaceae bacterium]
MNLMICVNNDGYRASLKTRTVYQCIEDEKAKRRGMVRVVDESGEDYLYDADMFLPIQLSLEIERQLFKHAT